MQIIIPAKDSFDVPEGRYRAVCIDAREKRQPSTGSSRSQAQPYLRIVWEIPELSDCKTRYVVGKNYEPTMEQGGNLRKDLRSWLGKDFDPGVFDTDTLSGRQATVTVTHIHNEAHSKPYCWVERVEPTIEPELAEEAGHI